ncbi:MAG: undecaprenyl/decaprenyl-phosphate alpha-N-acetylglucosaminyl 1-phosphate transferase [Candidatus Sumerlaeia bacterium]|nr:undecaprenyl/decaprenyl-phosphate alpha-N-acetylglucosaminyl 1-phosphate transferase [Candidatus Sumerlaeia bacterium]
MGIADWVSLTLAMSLSLAFGAMATAFSMTLARWFKAMAIPNERSSHRVPTPRLGGVGFFIPIVAVVAVLDQYPDLINYTTGAAQPALLTLIRLLLICGTLAFIVGLLDDLIALPPWFKLIGQMICAGLFVYLGGRMVYEVIGMDIVSEIGGVFKRGEITKYSGAGFSQVALTQGIVLDGLWNRVVGLLGPAGAHVPPLAALVTFFWIIILMNAYNFMDGIDGLAGVFVLAVAVGLFAAYLPESYQPGLPGMKAHIGIILTLAAILAGLTLGFLFYNWPPAKTFLGDCGSQFIGFTLAAVLAQLTRVRTEPAVAILKRLKQVAGQPDTVERIYKDSDVLLRREAYVDLLAAVILVFPFLYDVIYTLIRRLAHGKPVWRAHHEHLYQRLIDLGWSHRKVVAFSAPFYFVHAGLFAAYCWVPNTGLRWAVAAVSLAPMVIYTCVVIALEKKALAGKRETEGTSQ